MRKFFLILALICIGSLIGCNKTDMGDSSLSTSIPSDEIHYTTSDGKIVEPFSLARFGEGVAIVSNTYENGKGIIKFNASVTSIGVDAFYGCKSLTSIIIPGSVASIEKMAMYACHNLTNVFVPNSVTSIEDDAFGNCVSLTSITIPESVTSIGRMAFAGCTSLTSITIPESVTSIGDAAFSYNNGIIAFYGKFASADNRCLIVGGSLNAFAVGSGETEYAIPSDVTSIGYAAFARCTSLTSITIPEGVTSIGDRAFAGCTSLTSITIPESVTSIGDAAFSYNNGIIAFYGKFASADNRCLIVGGSLNAFAVGSGETEYAIPYGVTSIGYEAFYHCGSLTNITIPEGVTSIGEWAFYYCESLTSITIPEGVTSIGVNVFCGCESLTSITIPESVTSIGEGAFRGCKSLTSIMIPESVTSIGGYLFVGCESLANVYFQATTPPKSLLYAFGVRESDILKSLQAIYVPKGSAELYKQALWEELHDLIQEYDFS